MEINILSRNDLIAFLQSECMSVKEISDYYNVSTHLIRRALADFEPVYRQGCGGLSLYLKSDVTNLPVIRKSGRKGNL